MTTDVRTFEPTAAAIHAYDQFKPVSAGAIYATNAAVAASLVLYLDLDKSQRALIVHYGQRRDMLNHNGPCRSLNDQLWSDGVRQALMDRHRELLCCIMVALLIPCDVDPYKIAPGDYAGIADIALANIRYGDHQ